MKEIGGYFELEFKKGNSFHPDAIALNTTRNCFEYVLRTKKIRRVLIPHYTCEVMLEPVNKLGIDYAYYHIDSNLEPVIRNKDLKNTILLYTNYFGVKQNFIKIFSKKKIDLIIDNSQAFYQPQIGGRDTFYSARKFFGVPDGAYLYTDSISDIELEQDFSYSRSSYLFKRIELGANASYNDFLQNESMLHDQPIRKMSVLSHTILESIDYNKSKAIRERNFLYLHSFLDRKNEFQVDLSDFSGPFYYPFLFKSDEIRKCLLENKIYVSRLWESVLKTTNKGDFEQYLTDYLYPLPIDQRYDIADMERILTVLRPLI